MEKVVKDEKYDTSRLTKISVDFVVCDLFLNNDMSLTAKNISDQRLLHLM